MRAVSIVLVCCAVTSAQADRSVLIVTAPPPLDGERLADTLRSYLDAYEVDVRAVAPPAGGDLREDLRTTARAGDAAGAIASVRVDASGAGVELLVVDRVASKALVAQVPRPPRDQDLYRALALKVQSLLRSALYEEAERLVEKPALARLVAPPSAPPAAVARGRDRDRLAFEVAYAFNSFPLGALFAHGVSVVGRGEPVRLLELSLGVQALTPISVTQGDVSAVVYHVPITAAIGVHLRRPRLEVAAAAVAQVGVVSVNATSASASVRSALDAVPGLGVQLSGRVRVVANVWLYLRGTVLGMLTHHQYTVRAAPIVDLERLQVGLEAGLGVAVW